MRVRVLLPAAGVAAIAGVLKAWSPGAPQPFLGEDGRPLAGSISAKVRIPINRTDQGMFLKGVDVSNPVLLFLHGGPGMPEYWLTRRYPTNLERSFTVAWWEQRGAGLSFDAGRRRETMTVEQFIDDTLAVARYLRERFDKEKIYLMAHSWGSYVGLQAAARAPSLFHAYIGVGQVTYQVQSEMESYAYMLRRFKERGNTRLVRKLEGGPVTMAVPLPRPYAAVRDRAMHSLGVGTTRDMRSVVTGLFLPSWRFPEYTLGEKVDLWRGKIASRRSGLWDRMLSTDLARQVTELSLPAYFFHGGHDYTVSYSQAKRYADELKAPVKGFYTFRSSAHSPIFEEPDRSVTILNGDVLAGTNRTADAD